MMKMTFPYCAVLVWLYVLALISGVADAHLRIGRHSQQERQRHRQLLVRYLKSKADRISPAFYEQLSAGVTYDTLIGEHQTEDDTYGTCTVSGSVNFAVSKISGARVGSSPRPPSSPTQLVPVAGKEDEGLWTLTTSLDPFEADMTATVLGRYCGRVMDFTSFGHVKVDGALVKATIRLKGPMNRPEVIEMVDVKQHQIEFESSSSFTQLTKRLPRASVEQNINDFLHTLFTSRFQAVMEGELTKRASAEYQ